MQRNFNFFPPKGGVSPYYSPRMILHQKSLDYKKHCSIPFGSYVQAHNETEPRNVQFPRTIYHRYTDNEQGGHTLLDLRTGKLITRRNVTIIPISSNIINIVPQMAEKTELKMAVKLRVKRALHYMTPLGLQEWIWMQNNPKPKMK